MAFWWSFGRGFKVTLKVPNVARYVSSVHTRAVISEQTGLLHTAAAHCPALLPQRPDLQRRSFASNGKIFYFCTLPKLHGHLYITILIRYLEFFDKIQKHVCILSGTQPTAVHT